MSRDPGDRPMLRVVRGAPTPEELAALVAVLATRAAGHAGRAGRPAARRTEWGAPTRLLRRPDCPRPEGWRSSGLPR